MTEQWTVPAWAAVVGAALVAVLVLLVVLSLVRLRRTARRLDGRTAALAAELSDLRDELGRAVGRPVPDGAPDTARDDGAEHASYVITRLGDHAPPAGPSDEPVVTLPPGVLADVVLREGALRSASLLHGLRRALAPESRNRIRFEMRREVKRQRKTRRSETREALRDLHARRRAEEPAA